LERECVSRKLVRIYLINQTPGGPLVHALRARVGILLLITNEFSTEGLRAYGRRFGGTVVFTARLSARSVAEPHVTLGSSHCVHGPTQCTTLSYTIKMDPIDAALTALELQDPPNYTRIAKEFNIICFTLSRHYRQITRAREDATEMKSLLLI